MGEESAYRRSKATAAIRRPQWSFLYDFVQKVLDTVYSRLRNKRRGTLIKFWAFFPVATCLLKGVHLLTFFIF